MDVNDDGKIDILSGCYSRHSSDMAGLFYVLRGTGDAFRKAVALDGTDGQPLILPAGSGQNDVIDKICTRPFACDLDGDGKLDIVAGNFRGTFGVFRGAGGGKFEPQANWLPDVAVKWHSDPFLVDWDGDGDLDLLSGSGKGGVFLFTNVGSKTAPKFGPKVTLVAPTGDQRGEFRFGDAHYVGPSANTRVWAADVDGDGKLDLLVGDSVTLYYTGEGVAEGAARAKDAEWQKRSQALRGNYPSNGDAAAKKKWQEDYAKLNKERLAFLREESTGFVWLYRQK